MEPVAEALARRDPTSVVVVKPGFETPVEVSSSSIIAIESTAGWSIIPTSVPRIERAVLPKACSFMGPAGLTSFLVIPLLFALFQFLQFGLRSFFDTVFLVSELLLLLHEVLDLFL